MNNKLYDIVIVGCGVSACFFAYQLITYNDKLKILIIEKGDKLEKRICPKKKLYLEECQNCNCCKNLFGFSGLGKSEGKYNYSTQFGGFLEDKISDKEIEELFEQVDFIINNLGGEYKEVYTTYNKEIYQKARENGSKALFSKIHHLGNTISLNVYNNLYNILKRKVSFLFNTEVIKIEKKKNFITYSNINKYESEKVVVATGTNSQPVENLLNNNVSINSLINRVDVGLRFETNISKFENIIKSFGEFKIQNNNEYTYCMNPYGYVVEKNINFHKCADGQNYLEKGVKSSNINFSIFVPFIFNSDFDLLVFLNKLKEKCDNKIIVQRLIDLKNDQNTTLKDIHTNSIQPTLDAKVGNINNIFDDSFIDKILLMIEKIEKILDIKINEDSLIYSYDIKKYSNKINIDRGFQTPFVNLYVIGDCSGYTCSLSQAAVSGLYLANKIYNQKSKNI